MWIGMADRGRASTGRAGWIILLSLLAVGLSGCNQIDAVRDDSAAGNEPTARLLGRAEAGEAEAQLAV